jgi:predicted RNA binding protein YcfA (HicA-like mRNA interferase family)
VPDFLVRRIKGSHHYMQHRHDRSRITIVPYHNRDLKPGTLSRIVKDAGLTRQEFVDLL